MYVVSWGHGVQEEVQRITNIQSALTTLQSCIILLSLYHLAVTASTIPYFRLFFGVLLSCICDETSMCGAI